MGIRNWIRGKRTSKLIPLAIGWGPAERNLPLEYVHDKTGLDITVYRKIAQMVNAHAYASAEELAGLLGREPRDQLVHYFHDMLTTMSILP